MMTSPTAVSEIVFGVVSAGVGADGVVLSGASEKIPDDPINSSQKVIAKNRFIIKKIPPRALAREYFG
jgi:hypothetical protein